MSEDGEEKRPTLPEEEGRVRDIVVFSILVYLSDQLTKATISILPEGESIQAVPGLVSITKLHNTGISFGLFQQNNSLLIWLSVIILGVLLYMLPRFKHFYEKLFFGLIMAGLFGNLTDRIFRGFVVDFIDLHWWPVFNIADSAIFIGVFSLIIYEITCWYKDCSCIEE